MRALKKKTNTNLEPEQDKVLLGDAPALKIVAVGKSGRSDLSVRHDEYIARYTSAKGKYNVNRKHIR